MKRYFLPTLWIFILLIFPFDRGPETIWFNSVLTWSAALSLVYYIALSWKHQKFILRHPSIQITFGLFVLWILLSNLWTIDAFATMYKSLTYLSVFILFFVTLNSPETDLSEKWIFFALILLFAVEMIFGIVQSFFFSSGVPIANSSFFRAHGHFVWPNTFAGFIVLVWPLVFWKYLNVNKRLHSISLYVLLILALFVLGLTYSRGGWLAFLLSSGLIYLVLLLRYRLVKTHSSKLIAVVAGFIVIWVFISVLPGSAVSNRIESFVNPSSFGRQDIWANTLHLASQKPWLGYGFRTFHITSTQWFPFGIRYDFAHNDYLQFLLELGTVGLVFFAGFLVVWVLKGWNALKPNILKVNPPHYSPGLWIGMAGLLMHTFVDFDFYIPELVLIWVFFLAYCLRNQSVESTVEFTVKAEALPFQRFLLTTAVLVLLALSLIQPLSAHFGAVGTAAKENREPDRALQYYRYAQTLEPRSGNNAIHMGSVYSTKAYLETDHLKKWEWLNLAEKQFTRATDLGPLTWNYWQARGQFYKRHILQFISLGFPESKLTVLDTNRAGWRDMWLTIPKMNFFFKKALQLYPNNPDLWIERAETRVDFHQPDSSLKWYALYTQNMKNDLPALSEYADVLTRMKKYQQSMIILDSLIFRDSTAESGWFLKGRNYFYLGKNDSAKLCFDRVIHLNPHANYIAAWVDSLANKEMIQGSNK